MSYPASSHDPNGINALAASNSRLAAWAVKSEAPPAYTFPTSFPLGGRYTTTPLVDVRQLKDHLVLLRAFTKLKTKVEALANRDAGIPHMPSDKERRWAWFLGLAVERFETWCKALKPSDSEKGMETVLPPIDVLLVWHAYLLNPGWYAEDLGRVTALEGLKKAGDVLGASLGGDLGKVVISEPSAPRINQWVRLTAAPFDPFQAAPHMMYRNITCPKCSAGVHASYMTDAGTGFYNKASRRAARPPNVNSKSRTTP
ncbi:hypothetical protein DFH09DRAFT_1362572 [Mycena vulgaris]|nr:hypothetical protein DFH09DRAFT_1362572 [Mycena vulgaris]